MPELPEVETIRRDLAPLVVGRRVERVRIHPGAERLAVTDPPREKERGLARRAPPGPTRGGRGSVPGRAGPSARSAGTASTWCSA